MINAAKFYFDMHHLVSGITFLIHYTSLVQTSLFTFTLLHNAHMLVFVFIITTFTNHHPSLLSSSILG